jgi:hypothetical protein
MYCHNLKIKNKFSPCLKETIDSEIYLSKLKKSCSNDYLVKRKKLILENEDIYKVQDDDFQYVFFSFTLIYIFFILITYQISKPYETGSFLNEMGPLGLEYKESIIDNIGLMVYKNHAKKNKSYAIKLIIIAFLIWLSIKIYLYYFHDKLILKYNKIFDKKCENSIKFNCCIKLYKLNQYNTQVKAKRNDELNIKNINLKKEIEELKSTKKNTTHNSHSLNIKTRLPNTIEPIRQINGTIPPVNIQTNVPTNKPNSLNLKTRLPNTIEPIRQINRSLPPVNITQVPTKKPNSLNLKTRLPNTIKPIRQINGSLPPVNIQTNVPTGIPINSNIQYYTNMPSESPSPF